MRSKNIVGFLLCVAIFFMGFAVHGNLALYLNLSALLVVAGGSLGAAFLSFRWERLVIVSKVLVASYRKRLKRPEEIVEILVDLSVKSKFKGILSLQEDEEEATFLFLRQGLGYLVDGFKGPQIRDFLSTEMYFFKMRREDCERVLRTVADYLPSFGLIGSVVGLIAMLSGIGDTAVILATIPIALTSTLYGVVLANFVFLPFAANLRERTDQELLLQKIIMEGVVAMESEINPRILEKKLKSFLTPSLRAGQLVSLERIRQKFHILPETESRPAEAGPAASRE